MISILKRAFLILIMVGYMTLIWIQSSRFDPESLAGLTSSISRSVFFFIGASLEIAHLFQFGLLYLCIILVFLSFGTLKTWQEATAACIALAYGILDEIHQLHVPFRSFSLIDLLKDGIGVLVFGWLIHRSYFYRKNSRIGKWLRKMAE